MSSKPNPTNLVYILVALSFFPCQIVGMFIPSKFMMRQNWANGRREIAGFVGPYFGLQTSDRNVRSFTRSHASPFRGGRHKSFQLFTTRVDTDFQKIVPNIDTEEEEEEIEFAGKDELIDPVELSNDEESSSLAGLSPGSNDGFFVTGLFKTTEGEFDFEQVQSLVDYADIQRLGLTPYNISAPVALLMLNPSEFPTLTRARKACRKANVMIHRGPLAADEKTGEDAFDLSKCFRARVGDRVFPGDVIAKQVRMGEGSFPIMNHQKPFDLPVVFEDDYFAIVNKPAGVVVYAHRKGGHGIMTVRAALPFAVKPPKVGTYSTLRRPQPVHRLDKPTSGLLVVAKTKPAMVNLSHQFRDRKVKKSYVAVLNGIPAELAEAAISSESAHGLGVDVNPNSSAKWQLIDHPLDDKSAVTIWRSLKYAKSLKAKENYVTSVELKPKSGRYHQLRRHMAWVCERPIIGDSEYDGGGDAMQLRERGLFLCSNKVSLEHPFYNTEEGRAVFDKLSEKERSHKKGLGLSSEGRVMVSVEIDIPDKFEDFMTREEDRYNRLSSQQP